MNTMTIKYFYVAVAVVLILPALIIAQKYLNSHDNALIVKLKEDYSIYRLNPRTGESQKIYHSHEYRAHNISVVPNNRYVAFVEETCPLIDRNGHSVVPEYSLTIIDNSGELVHRIDKNVKRYAWSPDGEKIAFLTFEPCDPDYEYKCPTGAWIFDKETAEMNRIADRATEINWAIHNSSLYLYDSGKVMKCNNKSMQLQNEHYKDIYFSPDGKFYLVLWKDEGRPIQIYETASKSKLLDVKVYHQLLSHGDTAESAPKGIGELWSANDLEPLCGWVFNSGHYLLFTKRDVITETEGDGPVKVIKSQKISSQTNFIFNPENQRVVKQFEGLISSWVGDRNKLIVEQGNNVIFEGIP